MICTKCGKELNEEWKVCPFCQTEVVSKDSCDTEDKDVGSVELDNIAKKYAFEARRRTGRFGFKRIESEAEINGENVKVKTGDKKKGEYSFQKSDIAIVSFATIPMIGAMDIIRFIIFAILIPFTYGLSCFAIALFLKFTLVKNAQVKLVDGRKVQIPIRQKADMVEFLSNVGYSESEVAKLEQSKVSTTRLVLVEWISTLILLLLAAITIPVGLKLYADNMNTAEQNVPEIDNVVRTFDEVGGYSAWVESDYSSKIRTDIVVSLPITQREADNYAVQIGTSLGDIVYVKERDGSLSTEWEWLQNATAFDEDYNSAVFEVTLTIAEYCVLDDEIIPIFFVDDIVSYQTEDGTDNEFENEFVEEYYVFLDSDKRYLSEDEIRQVEADMLRIGRNEIYARHGAIFSSEDLKDYFMSQSWYEGTTPVSEITNSDLNDFEIKNLALIKSIEDEINNVNYTTDVTNEIDTSIIEEYLHESGYWGNESEVEIYFEAIYDENKLDFCIVYESGMVEGYTATITSENTAVYESGDDVFLIEFEDFYEFYATGEIGGCELSGSYVAMVS